jgi:hypothetical protein
VRERAQVGEDEAGSADPLRQNLACLGHRGAERQDVRPRSRVACRGRGRAQEGHHRRIEAVGCPSAHLLALGIARIRGHRVSRRLGVDCGLLTSR